MHWYLQNLHYLFHRQVMQYCRGDTISCLTVNFSYNSGRNMIFLTSSNNKIPINVCYPDSQRGKGFFWIWK